MNKNSLLTCILLLWFIPVMAQVKYTVKGTIIDKETSEALMGANVQVLSLPDSAMVTGAMADDLGAFHLKELKQNNYALKISFMGYVSRVLPLNLKQRKGAHQVDLGYLTLSADSKMLKETVVSTTVAKVQVSGDSIQFNPAAYRVPQGSTLEALVKLLPGAEVDDDGNITINGKSVSKILVDGKEFFLNDKSVAMKNIPIDIIDKIKSYERKSDMARITGVDDGEEETVLDLSVKKGKKNGWFGNAMTGIGDAHRYNARGIVNYFNETSTVSAFGNGRNVPEQRGWWPQPGLNSYKETGLNFASQNAVMETGGSVSYKYNGSDLYNQSNTRNLTDPLSKYAKSNRQSYNSNHDLEAQFKMEWRPDTMTTVLFRPNFSYSNKSGMNRSNNGQFYDDVSEYTIEEALQLADYVVNSNVDHSQSHSNSTYAQGDLQVTRRLSKPGRNVTLRMSGNYSHSENQSLSANDVYNSITSRDHTYNNRYYDTPARSYNMTGQFVWNEPIGDRLYLSLNYRYSYSYSKNDQQAFVYDEEAYSDLVHNLDACRYDIDEVLRIMREAKYMLRDTVELSQFSERRNYNQRIGLQIRQVREKYNFSAGIDAFPETSKLDYRYMGKEYPEISRSVFNLSPRVNLRVNFDKTTNLQFRYNGRTSQPNMTDMLDIEDDSNPLRIKRGNPNLKPSMSHNWNANFNTFKAETQRGLWSWLYGSMTRNSISNLESHSATSVVTVTPMNINGNWNIGAGVGSNIGLGKEKKFSIGGNIGGGFNNNVGYYSYQWAEVVNKDTIMHYVNGDKSVTKRTNLNFGLNTSYRNDYVSIELRGNLRQSFSENNLNRRSDMNTQDFRYGSDIRINLPWGTEIATNIFMNSRRGYSEKSMNTDELLWNASVSQSFLKGNALTIKGEVFDILGQQTNISRSVSATSVNDSRTNGIYQYGLISLIYRFSVFAGRNTMGTKDERRDNEPRRRGW